MQSETGFPSSHQLKSYVAYKSRLKLAARAVLSADAGLLVLYRESYLASRGGAVVPNFLVRQRTAFLSIKNRIYGEQELSSS